MEVLSIENVAKHEKDTTLFPSFDLKIYKQHSIAIYSSLNVRQALLNMFIGKTTVAPGKIFVNHESIVANKRHYLSHIAVCFFDEGMYERLTVIDCMKFYRDLYQSKQTFDYILQLTQLEEKKYHKISKLTFSERRRIQFARMLLQNAALYIFEEADLNVDLETKRVFSTIIDTLKQDQKAILILTGNMENAITLADNVYRLDENGLHQIEIDKDETEETDKEVTELDESGEQAFQFNKIPTKVNEKIVLFDPPEIDYIESKNGQAYLFIKGEAFPTSFTLNELEERLKHFGFFRCHRSYIVNLQKVREVITWTRNSFNLILDDQAKSSIPLSKAKMAQLKEMLGLK